MNRTLLSFVLIIFCCTAFADVNVDSLLNVYQNQTGAKKNSAEKALIEYFNAQEYYEYPISLHKKYNKSYNEMLVYLGVSIDYFYNSNFQRAIKFAEKSITVTHPDSLHWLGSAYEIINCSYYRLGQYDKALDYAKKNYNIGLKIKDNPLTTSALNSIAAILISTNHVEDALSLINKAIDIDRESGEQDEASLAIHLGTKCEILNRLGRGKEALECINESLAIDQKAGRTNKVGIRLSQKSDIYASMEDWKNCRNICLQALDIFNQTNNLVSKVITLKQLGNCEIKLKNYDAARQYLFEGEKLCQENNINSQLWNVQHRIYISYKEEKDYKNALDYLERSMQNHDSVNQEEYQHMISESMVLFDTKEKEDQLALQQLKNKHNRTLIVILVFGILLTAAFLFVSTRLANTRKKSNDYLHRLNQAKNRIFSVFAHDLKTPVAAQKMVLDFMSNHYDQIDEKTKVEQITQLKQSNDNLYNLLVGLLEWASVDSGKITYTPIYADLRNVISNTVGLVSAQCKQKNISITYNVDNEQLVYSDVNFLEIILRNLLTNAIKFSHPENSIEIEVSDKGTEKVLSVIDHGVGMDEQQLSTLFTLSNQTKSGTNGEKGTGIGLNLCSELAKMNKGSLSASSVKGEGSTFTLTIPTKEP